MESSSSSSSTSSAPEKSHPLRNFKLPSQPIFVSPAPLRHPSLLALPPPPPRQVQVINRKASVTRFARNPYKKSYFEEDEVEIEPASKMIKSGNQLESRSEEAVKVWNLRPRNGPGEKTTTTTMAAAGNAGVAKKEELGLNISLTKREIQEDILYLTGTNPSRRPMRRTKLVQKQLDAVFPGSGLGSITPETYEVTENSRRG